MKSAPILCGAIGLVGLLLGGRAGGSTEGQVVILSGDTQGYLSPCGCTEPMTGGIRRRATAIRSLSAPGRTTILENGGTVEGAQRQDELKAETVVQAMAALGVAAINVGPEEMRLGRGEMIQLSQLADGALTTLTAPVDGVQETIRSGPFLIGGASESREAFGGRAITAAEAATRLVDRAADEGLVPILMLRGDRDQARAIARANPKIALVQYSSVGEPPTQAERIGGTVLATVGEHGKHVVRLVYADGKFSGYRVYPLGPELRDDPEVSRYYAAYLRRVTSGGLLAKVPRKAAAGYAGSWACAACHGGPMRVWKQSHHRTAFQTLEMRGHGADPDCVRCHSVGVEYADGFRSRTATPALAGVGCESCHGPGAAHVQFPRKNALPRLTSRACVGCHNPQNSPNFQFESYWQKIAHR